MALCHAHARKIKGHCAQSFSFKTAKTKDSHTKVNWWRHQANLDRHVFIYPSLPSLICRSVMQFYWISLLLFSTMWTKTSKIRYCKMFLFSSLLQLQARRSLRPRQVQGLLQAVPLRKQLPEDQVRWTLLLRSFLPNLTDNNHHDQPVRLARTPH